MACETAPSIPKRMSFPLAPPPTFSEGQGIYTGPGQTSAPPQIEVDPGGHFNGQVPGSRADNAAFELAQRSFAG